MRGTSIEILEWITHHHEFAPMLQMSRQRLVGLRIRLNQGNLPMHTIDSYLERIKNRTESLRTSVVGSAYCGLPRVIKLRDSFTLPAIVRDKHGRFFSEIALIKLASKDDKLQDLNLDKVCLAIKRGDMPSKEVVRAVLRRKGWTMFEERMELPSVWDVI